eukprot:PhF_6_TR8780/c0_g1_i2/m.13905
MSSSNNGMLSVCSTKARTIVIAVIACTVVVSSIAIILYILDSAATTTVEKFVEVDQRRTLTFATDYVMSHFLESVPFLQLGYELRRGGDCSMMNETVLREYFEDQIRMLRVGVVDYVYISTLFESTGQWWDCNCALDRVNNVYVCQRPRYSPEQQTYVSDIFMFPENVTFPLPMVVDSVMTEDFRNDYYIQEISKLTPESVNGSWMDPYVYFDGTINQSKPLITLTLPLAFNGNLTATTRAISVDFNLDSLNQVLGRVKPHPTTLLFLLDAKSQVIIATSDSWMMSYEDPATAKVRLFSNVNHPNPLVREAVAVLLARQKHLVISEHNEDTTLWDRYSIFSGNYQVGSLHYFNRNLHQIIFGITPNSVYFQDIEGSRGTSIAIGSSVGVVAMFGIMALIYSNTRMHRNELLKHTRDVTNAPNVATTETSPIYIMFTDITGSTRLWGAKPLQMHKAMEQHNHVVRMIIKDNMAYEVKTIGDAFMIAMKDAQTAVRIANAIHVAMLKVDWDAALLAEPDASVEEVTDLTGNNTVTVFRGLRVRIGIHCGYPTVFWDEVSKGYDYYGECVNTAARLEAAARSGETVISASVLQNLSETFVASECVVRDLGTKSLKGIKESVRCYSVSPSVGTITLRYRRSEESDSDPASPTGFERCVT